MSTMARFALLIAVALACGTLGGVAWQKQRLDPLMAEAFEKATALERTLKTAQAEREQAVSRLSSTEREIDSLNRYIAALQENLSDSQSTDSFEEIVEFEIQEEPDATLDAPAPERGQWRRGRGEPPDPEMIERRREAGRQMRERIQNILEEAQLGATTRDSQERLDALAEYRDYQNDLREQFREVESDEEREVLREELRSAQQNARALVREEQNARFREFAESLGAKNVDDQNDVVRDLREILADPIFSMQQVFTSGGGFGRGGGGFRGRPRPTRAP